MYTVTIHCPCKLSMLSLSTVTVHDTLYSGTVHYHCTLHTALAHCNYTLSLYIVTIHCTMYIVHYTLYIVLHNGQGSTLALYTVTLHPLYALILPCHCTLSLYTVTINLVRFFLEGVDGNLSPPHFRL